MPEMKQTPKFINAHVRELCDRVNAKAEPIYITIMPESGCMPNDCFECVRQKLERDGGRVQYGWAIWEWPRVFVEAEPHAVYEGPDGSPWADITPSAFSDIRQRLFLPDDAAVYDFENEGALRHNVRLAVCHDPLIEDFFAAAKEYEDALNSIPGVNVAFHQIDAAMRKKVLEADQKKQEFVSLLGMKYTTRNARCFCGSGNKFKRCHGRGS